MPFINRAILPSKVSIIAANTIAIIDKSNLPSKANLIELNPIQTPMTVKVFGSIYLDQAGDQQNIYLLVIFFRVEGVQDDHCTLSFL